MGMLAVGVRLSGVRGVGALGVLAEGRKYWQCAHCRAQARVRSGTLFHAPKLSLTQGFQAIYLVSQNKSNRS